jgi:hypothetical protein
MASKNEVKILEFFSFFGVQNQFFKITENGKLCQNFKTTELKYIYINKKYFGL